MRGRRRDYLRATLTWVKLQRFVGLTRLFVCRRVRPAAASKLYFRERLEISDVSTPDAIRPARREKSGFSPYANRQSKLLLGSLSDVSFCLI